MDLYVFQPHPTSVNYIKLPEIHRLRLLPGSAPFYNDHLIAGENQGVNCSVFGSELQTRTGTITIKTSGMRLVLRVPKVPTDIFGDLFYNVVSQAIGGNIDNRFCHRPWEEYGPSWGSNA